MLLDIAEVTWFIVNKCRADQVKMDAIVRALSMAFAMGWEILWPLILGFTLSGIVQAVVSHSEMSRLLPDDRPRSIGIALGLGAASSSALAEGVRFELTREQSPLPVFKTGALNHSATLPT